MIGRLLTRGPAAARRPALNESGRPMSQKEHKSHSLFARSFHKAKTTELSSDNSDSQKPMTWSDRASHETIDLEGIANDGYGYTVSITTGHASNKPRKLVKEQRVPRDAKSMKERQRAGGESALAVMTELTYDVRESFQEANTNSRAWKKPYSTGMSEADIEKGMQRAGAQLSDWSLLNEVSSIESPGAIAPTQRQEYGDELQDRSRPSTIPVQPMQAHRESISKPSRCILKIGISPSASPTSAIISPFSPSRPRSRPGSRQRSPAAPVNSSQFWASSPHSPLPQGAYHTGQSSPTTQIGFSRQADLSGPIESWSIRDGAVYSPPWEQPLPGSFHSSVNVVDGSRESLVDGEDSQLPVDEERGGLPHSILLPRDRLKRS
ncbi:hypothetical protein EJ08DRAFT_207688 [Tothia fuscella]|uniref:Uncharacterized protein n=1 Tax=Tothia fuscella TaxID=1048955 RepID=A0A9P4NT73_9PEZI|nr:hypothetical protein EJ08DRAFT_207688 [Tothia fuscella]